MAKSSHILTAVLATSTVACAGAQHAGQRYDDTMLTAAVETRLAVHPDASSFDIDVDTINATVTLRGEVPSDTEKTAAENVARNTEGVRGVRNLLEVRDQSVGEGLTEGWSDAGIHARVGSRLRSDPDVRSSRIDVDVDNGVVTLSGTVDSAGEKQTAEEVTRDTDGVRRVVNELVVPGEPRPAPMKQPKGD